MKQKPQSYCISYADFEENQASSRKENQDNFLSLNKKHLELSFLLTRNMSNREKPWLPDQSVDSKVDMLPAAKNNPNNSTYDHTCK